MFAEAPGADPRDQARRRAQPLLESDGAQGGQNIKYDLTVLARHGIAVAPIDTMVMSLPRCRAQ
jgi:DNA polymerase-1